MSKRKKNLIFAILILLLLMTTSYVSAECMCQTKDFTNNKEIWKNHWIPWPGTVTCQMNGKAVYYGQAKAQYIFPPFWSKWDDEPKRIYNGIYARAYSDFGGYDARVTTW